MSDKPTSFKHDNYVLFSMQHPKVFLPFFKRFLPAQIRALVDLERMAFVPQVLDTKKLRRKIMDLAYAAPFKADPDKSMRFYIIFEHKSSKQNLSPLHMMEYKLELMKRLYNPKTGKIPPIYSIVYYHGKQPYRGLKRLSDMFDVPDEIKPLLIDDMTVVDAYDLDDKKLLQFESHLAIMILTTKHIFDHDFNKVLVLLQPLLGKLKNSGWDLDYFDASVAYILKESEAESAKEILKLLEKAFAGKKGEIIMTVAAYLRAEGRAEGLEEGLQKGRIEGREEGREEGLELVLEVFDLIQKGLSIETVAKEAQLPEERVRQIAAKLRR